MGKSSLELDMTTNTVRKRAKTERKSRKFTDADLIKLNNVGLSLKTIGQALGVHQTSVKARMVDIGIQPCDTRRSFFEDIFLTLTEDQQEWLADQVETIHVKKWLTNLIVEAYNTRHS